MSQSVRLGAADEAAMMTLGKSLYRSVSPGTVIYLVGDLGMGKTTLSRGIVQAGGHKGAVKSPTYTLVEPYQLPAGTIYHFDLYRLSDPEELEFMGIRDYFDDFFLALIEWPQRGAGFLPHADLVVTIGLQGTGRVLDIEALSDTGQHCLDKLA